MTDHVLANLRQAEQQIEDFEAVVGRMQERIAELEAALRDLRLTARVLLQNAEGCARRHHGATSEAGWLRDCRLTVEAAEAVLEN